MNNGMVQAKTLVSANDRLLFNLFIAIAIHAAIILLVSFDLPEIKPAPVQTLEITLANYKSDKKVKDADFLAQANQEGSGTQKDKALPTTNRKAQFRDNQVRKVTPQPQPQAAPTQAQQKSNIVTTIQSSSQKVHKQQEEKKKLKRSSQEKTRQRIDLSSEIASLEAQLDQQVQTYAKRPRVLRLTAASTMQSKGAYYKEAWRRKVERVGNINYPQEARERKLYGSLRLLVSIKSDGNIKDIKVMQSSGHKVLDSAAIKIVKAAAPYPPFTGDLNDIDELEIIRTWRFEKGNYLSSF